VFLILLLDLDLLKRGTFSATFMLACVAALELEGISLEEL
jgi:hypothetical protein